MNTNHETTNEPATETASEIARETTNETTSDGGLVGVLGLLAATGLVAEMVYEGGADGCPHCASHVLWEAA